MPSRTSRLLQATLLVAALLPAAAFAGVRVTGDAPMPPPSNTVPHRSNLQFGAGPALLVTGRSTGTPTLVGWNGTAAIEGVITSHWSWVARGEHASFEHLVPTVVAAASEFTPGFGSSSLRETRDFDSFELGARFSPPTGSFHPYVEFAAGFGRFARRLEERDPANPASNRDVVTRELLTTVDLAFGGAWQPVGAPVGLFAELRGTSDPGRGGNAWVAPRVGLLALQR